MPLLEKQINIAFIKVSYDFEFLCDYNGRPDYHGRPRVLREAITNSPNKRFTLIRHYLDTKCHFVPVFRFCFRCSS